MKNKLLIILLLSLGKYHAQDYGLSSGLNVDMRRNTDQEIEDMKRASAIASQNRASQYKKMKLDYQSALEWNPNKETPFVMNSNGSYKAIIVWGDNYMKKGYVVVNNNIASKFIGEGDEILFVQTTKITNYRCLVKTQKGTTIEIIFSDIF